MLPCPDLGRKPQSCAVIPSRMEVSKVSGITCVGAPRNALGSSPFLASVVNRRARASCISSPVPPCPLESPIPPGMLNSVAQNQNSFPLLHERHDCVVVAELGALAVGRELPYLLGLISTQRYGRKLTRYWRVGILRECFWAYWLREQLLP